MTHYGLQYTKLLKIKAEELAAAKLELSDAEREHQKKKKEESEAGQIAADASYKFEQLCNEFRVLLSSKVADAVEAFKIAKGIYQI